MYKEGLEKLLEDYSAWLLEEKKLKEGYKQTIKKAIELNGISKAQMLLNCANLNRIRIYVLERIVADLESLRDENEKH